MLLLEMEVLASFSIKKAIKTIADPIPQFRKQLTTSKAAAAMLLRFCCKESKESRLQRPP
jgi:hypothetical protein